MKTNLPGSPLVDTLVPLRRRTLFSTRPGATLARSGKLEVDGFTPLNELEERIAARLEQEFAESITPRFVRQIVNEATALAATTSFPTLLLPALAEEKVRKASAWAVRQQGMLNPARTLAA